jgi:hypothetical protein
MADATNIEMIDDKSADSVRYLYGTESEGWVSNPDYKSDGLSANNSPAGEKPLKLPQRLQQRNTLVLEDDYIYTQRTLFINTYNEPQEMHDLPTSQFEGMQHADSTSTVVKCSFDLLENTLKGFTGWQSTSLSVIHIGKESSPSRLRKGWSGVLGARATT